MTGRAWLVIPMRSLADGKRRLAPGLDTKARRALNEYFLDHLLHEAAAWPGLARTVVVSPCTEVLLRARTAGARTLRQPEMPWLDEAGSQALNAALSLARSEVRRWGAQDLLVVASDLPLMTSPDLQRLVSRGHDGGGPARVVVASDLSGRGTNALYLPSSAQLPFRFGADSAARHGDAARELGLPVAHVHIPGLAFDIDTPADLALWRRRPTRAAPRRLEFMCPQQRSLSIRR